MAGDKLVASCNNAIEKIEVPDQGLSMWKNSALGPQYIPQLKETTSFPFFFSPCLFFPFFLFYIPSLFLFHLHSFPQYALCARPWEWGREWVRGKATSSGVVQLTVRLLTVMGEKFRKQFFSRE